MIRPVEAPPERAPTGHGGSPEIKWTEPLRRRILRAYAETGSLDIAAGESFLHRKSVTDYAAKNPRFNRRLAHAIAVFLGHKARQLPEETNPVKAQSLRYILARRCPEYRKESGELEKAVEKFVRNVTFAVAKPPPKPAAAARN